MPTLQITPDTLDLLQNVADTLAKSRKMVIITGAGISTNSGIPDFRSENGLYSLIQDQFERAEANANANANANGKKESYEEPNNTIPAIITTAAAAAAATATTASATATTTSFDVSGRPLKRRRTSRPDDNTPSTSSLSNPSLSLSRLASHDEPGLQEPLAADTGSVPCLKRQDSTQDGDVPKTRPDSSRRVTRSQATSLRPTLPRYLTQNSVDSSTSQESVFSDQPSSYDSSQTDISTLVDTPGQTSSHTRTNTPRRTAAHLTSSSPLSSPPPDLFDPYENTNSSTASSSHEDSDCSDTSESDDTQPSLDLFSSQGSGSNLRNMKGRDLFDCNIWADPLKTSVFYRFATSLRQRVREVEPTVTHRFIAQMRDVGKLARVYTQNIDEIEKKIGLSTDLKHGFGNKKRRSIKPQLPESSEKEEGTESPNDGGSPRTTDAAQTLHKPEDLASAQPKARLHLSPDKGVECVYLHGSLHSLRCFVCGKLCDWDEDDRESRTLSGEQPECPHCAGATAARQEKGKRALGIGKLRPDIVLYGEEHPQSDLISPIVQHDLAAGPDLLLVLGTSLRVHGLKVMVKEFAKAVHKKGGKVVFINFTKPSESAWGDVLDYWIEWDCDAWVEDLKIRKPLLWLSPGERIELDRQKRETLAEKKKEALRKRESIIEKKRDSLGDKKQLPPEQTKARVPPKNPVAMRNDYQCGAYIIWDIFQTLAKIGDRPFDNLGYMPSTSSTRTSAPAPGQSSKPNSEHRSEPNVHSQPQPTAEKRKRKPLPRRAPKQAQGPHSQPNLGGSSTIPIEFPKPSNLSPSTVVNTNPEESRPQQQPTTSSHADQPPAKKKRVRKSAPATFVAKEHVSQKRKSVNENKRHERHTGKDRYLQAVRELAKSRKTPTSGCSAVPNRLPATPGQTTPLGLEPHGQSPHPALGPGPSHLIGQEGLDRRHSTSSYTSYTFQPWVLPLPDLPNLQYGASTHHPPPTPVVAGPELSQGPLLPRLHENWKQSPQSRIEPLEIALLVGPASPLAEKGPSLSKSHGSYTWHHSTQPIYNDPLVGISRQATAPKPQWHMESNDDNTPSPSDQLRMEAANQLWQLRGKT
ncbi:DHS-like NAD/FAD-binding domain-containing protein [Hypoxylon argillaceum]|nr:DHS-like NAD/FAD-binding domain-containing protein [Hypoxylon argillaceum]